MFFPHACLFDLDGVLLDTEPLHSLAWTEAAEKFGTRLTKTQLQSLKGRRRIDCAKQILEWTDKKVDLNEFLSIHKPIAQKHLKNSQAIPGAEELIKWCFKEKLPIALVTSSSKSSFAFKSSSHPWLGMISTKVLGDDSSLGAGKPAPDPFLLAAKKLKVNPKKCWAIEDSISGSQSALAAGCQVWLVKQRNSDLIQHNYDFPKVNLKEVRDLQEILKGLKARKF